MAFRVATFNAGLAVGLLPRATERAAEAIAALGRVEADLLFVQEFWLDAHWDALQRALQPKFPHAFRPEPLLARGTGACAPADVEPLVTCAKARCAGLRDEALARCVVERCAEKALAMPTACLNCVASHPVGTLDEIVGRCLGSEADGDAGPARPSPYGGLIAYGGSFGTGLLSRAALGEPELFVFESSVNARGVLHAVVRAPGVGELRVFAAHLSPGGLEHGVQIERLLAFVDEKAGDRAALLVGDLNATPGSAPFAALLRAGFRDADPADARATYAPDGLETGRVPERGARLDHVLVRNVNARLETRRILDEPVVLDVGGSAIRTTLSDHFGVLALLDP